MLGLHSFGATHENALANCVQVPNAPSLQPQQANVNPRQLFHYKLGAISKPICKQGSDRHDEHSSYRAPRSRKDQDKSGAIHILGYCADESSSYGCARNQEGFRAGY